MNECALMREWTEYVDSLPVYEDEGLVAEQVMAMRRLERCERNVLAASGKPLPIYAAAIQEERKARAYAERIGALEVDLR